MISRSAPGKAELGATVFCTGAAVILVEIMGTRVIGPVFGVSLFVWSAFLAVTLGALAAGYYVGGVLADRIPSMRLLGLLVTASGIFLGFVPLLRAGMLGFALGFGPRGGALLAATLLFSPCLGVLGAVGPVAVRLATKTLDAAGRGVGSMYAISTAGSLVAALLTGFVLVPAFETSQILAGAALALVLLGAVPLAIRGLRSSVLAVVVPVFGAMAPEPNLPPGISVRAQAQSLYGLVQVIDDDHRGVRFLRADHSVIGAQWLNDRAPAFAFVHVLESVRFLRPEARNLLQIGLGTGSLALALKPTGITVDAVEIDPAVVRFAKEYFGFSTAGEIYIEDARTFIRRAPRQYDVVVHDTFTGGTTPEHLLSLEVVGGLRALLRSDGVLLLNFAGYQSGPHAEASWAVARTLQAGFRHVRIFRDSPPDDQPDSVANLIFFASDGPLDFAIPPNASFENATCEQVLRSFQNWEVLKQIPAGPVITDSHNSLGRQQLAVAEEHFKAMNELLPAEVWLQ